MREKAKQLLLYRTVTNHCLSAIHKPSIKWQSYLKDIKNTDRVHKSKMISILLEYISPKSQHMRLFPNAMNRRSLKKHIMPCKSRKEDGDETFASIPPLDLPPSKIWQTRLCQIGALVCSPLSLQNRCGSFMPIPACTGRAAHRHTSGLISQHSHQPKPLKA